MTTESHQIAAFFAAVLARDPFGCPIPIRDSDGRIFRHGDGSAEGDILTIVVTDPVGRAKREYRALFQLVAEDPPDAAGHMNLFLRMRKRRVRDGWRRLRRVRARRLGT